MNIFLLFFFSSLQMFYCKHHLNCSVLRDNLAESLSNFTSCAIENSRPIKLCQSCISSYLDILHSYKKLTNTNASHDDGKCIDEFVNLDRLQIVDSVYKNANDLWNKAKCYECFTFENETLTDTPSAETIKFNNLLDKTSTCINEGQADGSIFCTFCIELYLELNKYYDSISNVNDKIGVCMDIVDSMNGTRKFWSENCCEYRKNPEYIFIGSTVCAILITILFYILTKYCTDMKTTLIVKQSRFGESRIANQDSQ